MFRVGVCGLGEAGGVLGGEDSESGKGGSCCEVEVVAAGARAGALLGARLDDVGIREVKD